MTVTFAVTVAFLLALRPLAKSVGLVDRPGGRKKHIGQVPIIGGVAMFCGILSGMTVIMPPSRELVSLCVASLILVAIGVADDKYHLPPSVRVVAQISAILIAFYGANVALFEIGNPLALGDIRMGPFTLIATAVVSLTVINAYNLIDGADGLAGSMALIALLSVSAVGGLEAASTTVALMIVAGIVGFLIFNFPVAWNRRVRTFMGDAGSTFLGFLIVWTTLGISQGADRLISPVYCLWFASIPVYDLLTCFVRRKLAGKSPFAPGRDHFHHTLLRGGMSHRQVLSLLTLLQATYACVALIAFYYDVAEPVMFAAWSALGLTQRIVLKKIALNHRYVKLQRKVRGAGRTP